MFSRNRKQSIEFTEKVIVRVRNNEPVSGVTKGMFTGETKASLNERFKKAKAALSQD